jgi:EAL domain-containing protein (putative c-di-GMP-specific phosphodiesterase class I)
MNIDPVVFGQPEHLDDVFSEVYPYASSIVLELTERGQLCGDAWVESVSRLRERGFEIALDDLGAGYNSLGAVAAVSPEIIKLDISLVSNLHLSQPKREMVRLLSEYAQRHQIKTVAEGIELREEADACTDLGIRWLQGYHLERPIPLDRYRSIYVN